MALEQMIYKFLGVLFVAVIIGTAIGGICILCIGKCCQRGQKRRLDEARKREMFAFKSSSTALGMTQAGQTMDEGGISPNMLKADSVSPATYDNVTPQGFRTKPDNRLMDTEEQEEENDEVRALGGDQSEENIG